MANITERFPFRRRAQAAPKPAEPVAPVTADDGISPQDFFQEFNERPDVQRILTRLAQVKDGDA
jgi:hypothetical protein